MKKSLIALAVLAASGASFAQSSVTLYGIVDAYLANATTEVTINGASSSLSQNVLESGGVSGSRWGVKGSEDLGGGLKANFLLENGFAVDTGAGGAGFSRYAYVGFSGGFGEVKFGKVGTAYDDIHGANNNTFDSALTAAPWLGYAGTGNNEIYYALPAMGGFTGAVSYALGEDKTNAVGAGSIFALNVFYAQGPFTAGYAFQKENSGNTLGLGMVSGFNAKLTAVGAPAADLLVTPAGSTAKYNLITGSYDFGVAKLKGSYDKADFNFGGNADLTAKEYQVGVDVPLSTAATLGVGYGHGVVSVGGTDLYTAKAFSGAVAYSLSPRTTAYVGFNNTKLTVNPSLINAETKGTTFAAGVKHTF